MSKYHITITNNATCETLADDDTDCIIGAYAADDGAYAIGHTDCDGAVLLTTLQSAKTAIEHCTKDSPLLLLLLLEMLDAKGPKADEPDDDDTDN